jgi:rSAM/selenodomain-associated transferase 2
LISIIIPVLNEAQTIGRCLTLLREHPEPNEVVVVDGGSKDETLDIIHKYPEAKCLLERHAGRGYQMNSGASTASGDILLFLHADTMLPPGGLSMVSEALKQRDVAAGSFTISFDYQYSFLRVYALFSRINHIFFTYGDQVFFMKRHIFSQIGGFAEIPFMEDVEIQRRLRKLGRFRKIQNPVVTSARRFKANGIIRQQLINAALVLLYHAGIAPEKLIRYYS